jgi:hypothetical protein
MFLFSIGEFHRTNDINQAQDYLEEKIVTNFQNVGDLPNYIQKLQVYTREFDRLGNIFVRVRDNITVPIPPQFSNFVVSGQAARIDLVPSGGYAVWVFVRGVTDWQDDPRMPLLQLAYSEKLSAPLDEVTVGVYDFQFAKYSSTRYSQRRINAVNKTLSDLLTLFPTPP